MKHFSKSKSTSILGSKIIKMVLVLVLGSFWLSSCRSHAIPCPSFSHLNKADKDQLGSSSKIKFDKNGRVKN
ncbi:hypothetical protein PZB74_16665 [Porifericola rhodea]|uniref:hypothetical protein n=1 Tax=Porifericola rhodea TaxID=930972 RepID=UPI00266625A0|nr:hypothetical protein [Porifericola rhodea]WKN30597.1 hypothetical protein PZB74_16665 [Porifericola rhodea]